MPYDYSFTLTKRTRRMLKRLIDDRNLSKSNEACGDVWLMTAIRVNIASKKCRTLQTSLKTPRWRKEKSARVKREERERVRLPLARAFPFPSLFPNACHVTLHVSIHHQPTWYSQCDGYMKYTSLRENGGCLDQQWKQIVLMASLNIWTLT